MPVGAPHVKGDGTAPAWQVGVDVADAALDGAAEGGVGSVVIGAVSGAAVAVSGELPAAGEEDPFIGVEGKGAVVVIGGAPRCYGIDFFACGELEFVGPSGVGLYLLEFSSAQ